MKIIKRYNYFLILLLASFLSSLYSKSLKDNISFGIVMGEPMGLDVKLQKKKNYGVDFALGFNTLEKYFYLNTDFLVFDYDKISTKELTGKLPVFWGLGVKVENTKNDTEVGLRIVFGAEYIFKEIPFNIFAKIVPAIDVTPSTSVYISPAIGIRYIF